MRAKRPRYSRRTLESVQTELRRRPVLRRAKSDVRDIYARKMAVNYALRTDDQYPVLYVLDGTSQDVHTATAAAELARASPMPEVIVVGIPNTRGNRERYQTPPMLPLDVENPKSPPGSRNRYFAFIKSGLIPAIEREYQIARTSPRSFT